MKITRVTILVGVMTMLSLSVGFAAPKETKEKNPRAPSGQQETTNRGQEMKALRHELNSQKIRNRQQDAKNYSLQVQHHFNFSPPAHQAGHLERERALKNLETALQKLQHARWSYNPHDERGQGNMGRVQMLAPYGHDKDSDRKELYGNRGRVVRPQEPVPDPIIEPEEPEPEPEPEPVPDPEPVPQPPF